MFNGPWESCMLVRGLNPSECASWIQAWGTVLAIIASAAVVLLVQRAQVRRDRDTKNKEEVRLLRLVGQFVFDVRAKLRDIEGHAIPFLHRNWTAIEAPIACVREVPFYRYPVESVAYAVAAALLTYDFLRAACEKLGTDLGTAADAAHIDESRQHALECFFRAEQAIEEALVQRGSQLQRIRISFGNEVFIETLVRDPV